MAFTIGSGTFTNGSATVTGVTLTSGTLAYFASGTRMVVGVNPVVQEVEAIAAPTVTTITLRSAWTGTGGTYSFLANQTSEGLRDAVQAIRTNNASLQSFIDSIDTAATADSVAQRDATGQLIATNVIIADKIIHDGDTNTAIRFPADDTVTVETNGSERLRVDSSGNVGINVLSPSEKLTVRTGSGYAAAFNTSVTTPSSTGISIGGFSNSSGGLGGSVGIKSYHDHSSTALSSMAFEVSGNTEVMRIDSSGNVGIGTSSPATKLDVSGAIRASTGILFGSDTTAANTLDDYEEGTFTPTYTASGGGSPGGGSPSGHYTKVGNIVTCHGIIALAKGTLSGDISLSGLPFTIKNISANGGTSVSIPYRWATDMPNLSLDPLLNSTSCLIFYGATTLSVPTLVTDADMINTASRNVMRFLIVYEV